jgi:hypothetical protein
MSANDASDAALQTEFEFTLPQGYPDHDGTLHTDGRMRLATAADEILPLKDPRVKSNEAYLTVILLSRVVTRLGTLDDVTPHVIENLFVSDLAYLQDLYARVNERGADVVDAVCPECDERFEVEMNPGAGTGAADSDAIESPLLGDGQGEGMPGNPNPNSHPVPDLEPNPHLHPDPDSDLDPDLDPDPER